MCSNSKYNLDDSGVANYTAGMLTYLGQHKMHCNDRGSALSFLLFPLFFFLLPLRLL